MAYKALPFQFHLVFLMCLLLKNLITPEIGSSTKLPYICWIFVYVLKCNWATGEKWICEVLFS